MVISPDYVRMMAAYNTEMNRRLYDAAADHYGADRTGDDLFAAAKDVYFDYDSDAIRLDQQASLVRQRAAHKALAAG